MLVEKGLGFVSDTMNRIYYYNPITDTETGTSQYIFPEIIRIDPSQGWLNPVNSDGETVVYATAFGNQLLPNLPNYSNGNPFFQGQSGLANTSTVVVVDGKTKALQKTFSLRFDNGGGLLPVFINNFAVFTLSSAQAKYVNLPQLANKKVMYGSIGEGGLSDGKPFPAAAFPPPSSYQYQALVDIETEKVYNIGNTPYLFGNKIYNNKIYSMDQNSTVWENSLLSPRKILVSEVHNQINFAGPPLAADGSSVTFVPIWATIPGSPLVNFDNLFVDKNGNISMPGGLYSWTFPIDKY